MADYDKLVDKLFEKKENIINIDTLNEFIKQVVASNILSEVEDKQQLKTSQVKEQIFRLLPKFEFRERRLGTINTETRKLFESFLNSKLKGGTLKQKINYLEKFCQTGATGSDIQKISINEIFSTLTVLKIIEGIIKDSTPQAGGHQWEALIAGLFSSGYQTGDKSATDVVIGGTNYQIKLISKGGSISVAYVNLENYFQGDKPLGFIVSEKGDEELTFYQYFLDKEEYNKLRNKFLAKNAPKEKPSTVASPQEVAPPPEQQPAQISEQDMDLKKVTIPRSSFATDKTRIGVLKMNDEVFNAYSKRLEDEIGGVLNNLASLIDNVNIFYASTQPNAVDAGPEAIKNANFIASNITKSK